MMMRQKIFKIILLILILCMLFFVINSTYSKYINIEEQNTKLHISNWNILLNDINLSETKTFENLISISLDDNPNVADGLLVPTSTGHFYLNLDSTGTEVPFDFELTVGTPEASKSEFKASYNGNPWPSGSNYVYEIAIDIVYKDSTAIYWDNTGTLQYDPPVLEFQMPDTFVGVNGGIWWAESWYITDDKVLVIDKPYFWAWVIGEDSPHTDTNQTRIQLIFSQPLDENSTATDAFTSISIDEKKIGGSNTRIPDFKVTSYSLNGGALVPVTTGEYTIKGTIQPDMTGAPVKTQVLVNIEWYDVDSNTPNYDSLANKDFLNNYSDAYMSKSFKDFNTIGNITGTNTTTNTSTDTNSTDTPSTDEGGDKALADLPVKLKVVQVLP